MMRHRELITTSTLGASVPSQAIVGIDRNTIRRQESASWVARRIRPTLPRAGRRSARGNGVLERRAGALGVLEYRSVDPGSRFTDHGSRVTIQYSITPPLQSE